MKACEKTFNDYRSIPVSQMMDDDKPREKALNLGIKSLTDAELLAILLGGGLPGLSVIDLAKNILTEMDGRLIAMAKTPIAEMVRRFKGVGEAKAITLAAAFELGERLQKAKESEARDDFSQIKTSDDAYRFIRHRLELLDHEEFWVMMLSRSNRVKSIFCVSRGGVSATVVDTRLVFREAINQLASGLILVHNHPSGTLQPSPQDDSLTRKFSEGAKTIEMSILDHLIITGNGYYSYRDNSRL